MPDFPTQQFNSYHLRLRPSDELRQGLAALGFPDMLNYFNSSEICFALRLMVPNRKENRDIKDLIKYEWLLCTEDDKPVIRESDPRFHFYDVEGSGDFEMVTAKPKEAERESRDSDYYRYQDRYWIMRFKSKAVKIGTFSKLGHYKVVMRFADTSGNWSDYMRMADFTIDDKDKTKQTFVIGIVLTLIGAIVTAILVHFIG